MTNTKQEFINEKGNKILLEIVLSFKVPDTNKDYIAFTINNDKSKEEVVVYLLGINNSVNPATIVPIPVGDYEQVRMTYELIKDAIVENEEK